MTRRIFGQDHPPRWVLVLSFSRVLLIERGKWTHNRLLRFDLDEILGRREDATLKAAAALLHRDCLLPPDGRSLLDSLDDNSHKHAFAVSEDLKYALRESIELIGNEAIRHLREVLKDKLYDRPDDALAGQLGLECLRYMYRLLFLFYIEARPDLGYAPMESETYRKGYSLEHLRDLELVRLTSEESLDGYYLHHAVQTLFGLIRDGFDGTRQGGAVDLLAAGTAAHLHHGFRIRALDSALFRAGSTPLLDRVKLRNRVLQQVVRLMSLTRPAKGRRGRRGRISYAQLGINQLGAVYEALLSYRGFFAEEDLYEVKKAGEDGDVLKSAWFVPARDLDDYQEEERVYDRDEEDRRKLRVHPRGRFIYRLAGRDRQKSASYYTPESLTRCVVKYALRELIPDDMPADRILDLTVCEPAMGSAAFLNEAVNQLAEKYLERKQRERGKRIPHAEYADELQQVKLYIADRNVYGVDLNPVARELAEVSLWLNCIQRGGHVPWFGYQLVCGNSLVGARRQVFRSATLGTQNRKPALWFNHAPERVAPPAESRRGRAGDPAPIGETRTHAVQRPAGSVYHFLLPDPGMVGYGDKAAKALEPDSFERIGNWRKKFFKPFADDQITELEALSDRVDELWTMHAEQLARDHRETEDTLPVWGRRVTEGERHTNQYLEGPHPRPGHLQRRHPHRQPLPPPEAGHGLLVRTLVLADPGRRPAAGPRRVPQRDHPRADRLRVPARHRSQPDRRPLRRRSTPSTPAPSPGASRTRSGCWTSTSCSSSSHGSGSSTTLLGGTGSTIGNSRSRTCSMGSAPTGGSGADSIWFWGIRRGSRWSGRKAGCWETTTRCSCCGGDRRRRSRRCGARCSSAGVAWRLRPNCHDRPSQCSRSGRRIPVRAAAGLSLQAVAAIPPQAARGVRPA